MVKVNSRELSLVASKNLLTVTNDEVKAPQVQLADALHRAELAEAVAAERKDTIEVFKKTLLILEAATPPGPVEASVRTWFSRRK